MTLALYLLSRWQMVLTINAAIATVSVKAVASKIMHEAFQPRHMNSNGPLTSLVSTGDGRIFVPLYLLPCYPLY